MSKEEKEYKPRTSKTQVGIIEESYMKNKTLDDLIYSYMRTHSFYQEDKNFTYCYKSDVIASEIIKYYKEYGKKPFPYSKDTIRSHTKLLINAGWIYEDTLKQKKIYVMKEPSDGEYITIPLDILTLLMNTANPFIIKVYSYLKNKYKQHIWIKENKNPNIDKFSFSRKDLLEVIGYSLDGGVSAKKNRQTIENILNCLVSNNLIEIHEEQEIINNNIKVKYFILDKVNGFSRKEKELKQPTKKKSIIKVDGHIIKSSKGEEKIEQILTSNNIKFEREKSFPTCGKGMFRFDFYLPNINTCIEYDGEQHFHPVEYFGGEDAFNRQIIYDNVKNEWCKKNGVNLIRIPYTDYDKIDISYIIQRLNL